MNTLKLKKEIKWIMIPASFAAMGLGMPSCPGQQAMQQQIEMLQTANTDLSKKVQAHSQQLTNLNNDMNQVKQILPQVTNLLTSQKTALDQLEQAVKELQAKSSKGTPAKKKR
jgi:septal ring factor EnvC (AmiA/AmiB activator)